MNSHIATTGGRGRWMRASVVALALTVPQALPAQQVALPVISADSAAAEMRLVVNIPAFRLDVYRGETLERTFRVTTGKRGYETPTGSYHINHIVWNPWWHPPQSDWARGRTPEAPGPRNPMGRAKLHFAELLYIHGTTNLAALGGIGSHGCVRMANADVLELARIVQEYATPEASSLVPSLVANPTRTRQVGMQRSVRLEIRYEVAEVREGRLELHPDVYGLSRPSAVRAEAALALMQAGVDRRTLDDARLQSFVSAPARATRSVALTELVRTETVASLAAGDR